MLLFWVMSLLTLIPAHACPSECLCVIAVGGVPTVHCDRPTLEHIPQGIPNNTMTFQMKGTRLVSVRQGDLSGLPLLRTLYLYDNQVQTIQVGAFDNNPDLEVLAVYNNKISEVSPGVFRGLNSLRELDMRANKITSIPAGVFNGLPSLWVVRLYENTINTMAVGAFSNLSSVEFFNFAANRLTRVVNGTFGSPQGATSLSLHENNISIIEPGALSSFVSLTSLYIYSNRISTLQGVFEGLREVTEVSAIPEFHCISPPALEGRVVRDLATNQLNCSCGAEEIPRIDTGGSTTEVPIGERALLRCKVNACPDAAVLWTAARGLFLTSQSEFPDMYVQADGTLVIPVVTPGDAGRYTCMAVNAFGTAEAGVVLNVTARQPLTTPPTGQAVGIHTTDRFISIFTTVLMFLIAFMK
ncbi:PREDICTED: leucine-rich repeat-containing protein 15-like isoform X1 [Branchiostoma belcheri]|uniref:Leucine-rich repeat-containing protein 15-like isoform X1 n=1 Tax=Branchiostoma belcheri TaxID=7741 RepID=A0A6P4XRU9_BRABE|nr:PREDICTED: leucine-rich repeat-containing protein 15-like isoform X1 [Branchiostoma belcheri]